MDTPKTSRREFCVHAMTFVTVASLIEGCGGSGGSPNTPGGGGGGTPQLATINGTAANGVVTVNVDAASPLASVGGAALLRASAGPGTFLVIRTAQDSFNAMTAVCTHEACEVTGFQNSTFVCPCHGSQYTTSGTVQAGPATQSLRRFQTQFTNSVLTITV
jgi:cytochrome b6-f complex iron-sulfur subunit